MQFRSCYRTLPEDGLIGTWSPLGVTWGRTPSSANPATMIEPSPVTAASLQCIPYAPNSEAPADTTATNTAGPIGRVVTAIRPAVMNMITALA